MIRTDAVAKVKAAMVLLIFFYTAAHAEVSPVNGVKEIEAQDFKVTLKKTSRSGRVLLFEDPEGGRPRVGKILLMKSGDEEIGAVRVLKLYPGKFASKIVLPFKSFMPGDTYRGIKKIGDKIMNLIKEREQRLQDPDAQKTDDELSREIAPDDAELDRGIPVPLKPEKAPKSSKAPEPLFNSKGEDIGAPEKLEIDEEDEEGMFAEANSGEVIGALDPFGNAFSFQFATISNLDKTESVTTYKALGLRLSYNFGRMSLIKKKTVQDMFTLEAGGFFYAIAGFEAPDDSVSILAFLPTLRYNILIGQYITLYGYGGAMINTVTSSTNVVETSTRKLSKVLPAGGVGGLLQFGPAWAIRADYGVDLFGIGVMLKF